MTALDIQTLADTTPASTGDASSDARQNLIDYASLGGFTLTAETHAWYAAVDTVDSPEEARAASTVLAELRGRDLPATREAANRLAEDTTLGELDTVVAVGKALALTLRVRSTLQVLVPAAYESEQLGAFAAATASGKWRKAQDAKLTLGQRLNLGRAARGLALAKRPRRSALHAALVAAASERTDWAALSPTGSRPVLPADLEFLDAAVQAVDDACAALAELGRLRVDSNPAALSLDELTGLVDRLASDEGTLHRLPALHALRAALEEQGYGELVAELTAARADADAVAEAVAREFGAVDSVKAEAEAESAGAGAGDVDVDVAEEAEAEAAAIVAATAAPVPVEAPAQGFVPAPREEEVTITEVTTPSETEVVAEAAVVAEAEAVAEAVVEAEVVAEAEAVVEAEAEAVAEAVTLAEAEVVTAAEATAPVEAVAAEAAVVEVAPAAPVTPVVAKPKAKASKAAAAKAKATPAAQATPTATATPASPEPAAGEPVGEGRRPRKPAFTPGRPVTAYSAEELVSVVDWIDSDGVKRSDDELLRAAMKELGFARLGPRIKDALGTAIASVRS
ncbi:hypothetical protein ACEZCY_02130 [Streptacidiphilus sp. N1-12]|uniref:Uncharacterized protein n=2 Tax=Streptacidiphilus alkalitolerans TaxID=3342712 RepID=A0ABV6V2Y0_9ACTN